MSKQIYLGKTILHQSENPIQGSWVQLDGEEYYAIQNFDQMPPFLMSIVSPSDHWMYLSSNGSLTAGRANPEQALFPYYTDDKIHDYAEITGSKTILMVTIGETSCLWEPFSVRTKGAYQTTGVLYKNAIGNKVIFEEINHYLQITFRYSWTNSERFGWVRKSSIVNHNDVEVNIDLIDGLQNLLPYGVNRNMQGMLSTLVDAYKKCEMVNDTSLGLFRLSSIPVDKAEPSEALKVTTVWSVGLTKCKYLMSSKQLDQFRFGENIAAENESLGVKGAYLVNAQILLVADEQKDWYTVAEVNQDVSAIVSLMNFFRQEKNPVSLIEQDIQKGSEQLINIVAQVDGLQFTADQQNVKRHFANVLFNNMRGGIPYRDYTVLKTDFSRHIEHFNRPLLNEVSGWLKLLPNELNYFDLINQATENGNADLIRLSLEYLPLMFSRRHGDPSRPWNLFSIKLKNDDGTPSLNYQGNWRDIFQNWEALAVSYPAFLPGIIAKFVNATTIDGFNAYKITRDGIEWEILDPEDPWSNIGYWGDHQIIYLEKLLELSEKLDPGKLQQWLKLPLFAYANVPYCLKSYPNLVKNPQDSILFDDAKNTAIEKLVTEIGADGKLIQLDNKVLQVNLTEKLVVPLFSKLSSFIPGAGIWMNTQRPEWNDANNALVGNGASMVTLYYMRRYVHFLQRLFKSSQNSAIEFSAEVASFLTTLKAIFENQDFQSGALNDKERRRIADQLGEAGSVFRTSVYSGLKGKKQELALDSIVAFLAAVQTSIDQTIGQNKRSDGLFHAYNLISFNEGELKISRLAEMLEGQVAVLSSGYLDPEASLELLNKLRNSALYRPDQASYMLYPNKKLPLFLDKNILSIADIKASKLLAALAQNGETSVIVSDENGSYHFNGLLNNSNALKNALGKLDAAIYSALISEEEVQVISLYEKLFDHQSFTGRSGSFYKYEGLGSIYWHMVSKLLLAVGETITKAIEANKSNLFIAELKKQYNEIRAGIGSHKSPAAYGAFPTDPYSHTPIMLGVQQPGMTGQVKEDVLSRWMELGLEVKNGRLCFHPEWVDVAEFVSGSLAQESYFIQHFNLKIEELTQGLLFSFCHIPIIYQKAAETKIQLELYDGNFLEWNTNELDEKWSSAIFKRSGEVKQITVSFK
ncbi:MAG: hypothetical protein ACERKD_15975 [Prolixibacteraceae bacterium]